MKTIFKFLIPFMVLMVCVSCEKDKLITQNITNPSDCIECVGWSWENGMARTLDNDSAEYSHFSFKAKVSGELIFSRRLSSQIKAFLEVKVNGKIFYNTTSSTSNFGDISIGNVKYNDIIIFRGYACDVKNIHIVGQAPANSGQGDPDDDPQWDF